MDKNLEDLVLIMQASNDKVASGYTKMRSYMKFFKKILAQIMSQKQHYLPEDMDTLKSQYPSTAFQTNNNNSSWEV